MTKKTDSVEEEIEIELEEETTEDRVAHDFLRADLNELRDVVNELHRQVNGGK